MSAAHESHAAEAMRRPGASRAAEEAAVRARMPEPPAQAARRSRRRSILSIVGVIVLWELVGRYVVTNPILFAPLSKVLAAGYDLLRDGELMQALAVSATEFALGFALATVVGVAIGFLMATNRFAQDVLDP